MFLLALRNQHSTDTANFTGSRNSAIENLLDDYVVIPAAVVLLLAGTFFQLTIWGFFAALLGKVDCYCIALIVFGTFWLFPWAVSATTVSGAQRLQALENPLYSFDAKGVLKLEQFCARITCLVVIIALC